MVYCLFHCSPKTRESAAPLIWSENAFLTAASTKACENAASTENPTTGRCALCVPAWLHGFFDGPAVLSESPCCTGRQDLVLQRSALTRGSAKAELHLKLWSCCPRHISLAKQLHKARELRGRYFSFPSYLRLSSLPFASPVFIFLSLSLRHI